MSNGFVMLGFPDQDILRLAVECHAQFCQRIQVNVPRLTCIQSVDKIFWDTRLFSQFAR